MKRTPIKKISEKRKAKIEEERELRRKEYEMFEEIWKERGPRSEISGKFLGREAKSIYFHHCLPKSRYPEYRLDKRNIIILSFEEHQNVENNTYFYEKVNEIKNKLIDEIQEKQRLGNTD